MKFVIALALLLFASCAWSQTENYVAPMAAMNTLTQARSVGASGNEVFLRTPPEAMDDQYGDDHKSVSLAVLYSLLLPGMGENYAGNYATGKYFTISEATLWLTFSSFTVYGNWAQNDAHSFAALHSGANINNSDPEYFVNIGDYASIDAYNLEMLRERELGLTYAPGSAAYKSNYWKWDSPANQNEYVNLKIGADNTFTDASFAAVAIAANHIISAIDAARLAISHNKNAEADMIELHASVISDGYHASGMMLTLTRTF